jgi:predicted transcriptional regulator
MGVLILSIQPVHAERILNGVKHFELRKTLPKNGFRRVYLYESGGVGVVGCFDTISILRMPVRKLWLAVGDNATPKERFFNYFGGRSVGCAIPIKNPIRFPRPVLLADIKKADPKFSVPISSRVTPRGTNSFACLRRPAGSLFSLAQRDCDVFEPPSTPSTLALLLKKLHQNMMRLLNSLPSIFFDPNDSAMIQMAF